MRTDVAVPPIDLSVLLVTYNSRPFIDLCLGAVEETVRRHAFEVIAVDNASPDGTAAHLRAHWPSVTTIDMGRNAGFAAANNRAFAASSGRHVVLLNGDAVVGPGALDDLVDHLDAHPEVGVVAPKLCNPDGSDQCTARAFPTPSAAIWGRRSPLTRAFPQSRYVRRYLTGRDRAGDEAFPVDWVSGACLMVRRQVVEQVGGLDEGFFMHWEDADWCRRISSAGHEVWCIPSIWVLHAEGGSRRGWPAPQVRHFHRGAYRYYRKHHLLGPRAVLRPVAAAALASRAALVMARNELRRRADDRPEPSPGLPDLAGDLR
ncbi:MAG: glycosyltransferase family 2 protein [Acidimicrobiia bacterium]